MQAIVPQSHLLCHNLTMPSVEITMISRLKYYLGLPEPLERLIFSQVSAKNSGTYDYAQAAEEKTRRRYEATKKESTGL